MEEYVSKLYKALFDNDIVNLKIMSTSNDSSNIRSESNSYTETIKEYVYDKVLTALTFIRKNTQSEKKTPLEERLKIRHIYQINHDNKINPLNMISNQMRIQDLQNILLESDPDVVYHIEYEYDCEIYRIILKREQLHHIHKIFEEENHPSNEIESVILDVKSDIDESDLHVHLVSMYAGPVGDFYQYLDLEHHEPHYGKYFLTHSCDSFLLEKDMEHTLKVEDILGQEYIFSHSTLDSSK
jgi:hypothetical protein